MIHYRAIVRTEENDFGFPVVGKVEDSAYIDDDVRRRVEPDPHNEVEDITGIEIITEVHYDLLIFDADGTLTPQRDGSCGEFHGELLPNVARFVHELHEIGVKVGIASNQSRRRDMNDIIDQMTWTREELHITPALATFASSGYRKKPGPRMLQEIMSAAQATPKNTLFVGDQDADRQAAEAAGVDFIPAEEFFGWEEVA